MNQFLEIADRCQARVKSLGTRDHDVVQTALSSLLRGSQDQGLIEGWNFMVEGRDLVIEIYKSPIWDARNHHRFHVFLETALEQMKEAIDAHRQRQ